MRKKLPGISPLMVLYCALGACHSDHGQAGEQQVMSKDSIVQYIKVLASDEFQGRKPFTVGELRTITFLQNKFKEIGLEPANGGSYLQDVPLVEISPNAPPLLSVQSPKTKIPLVNITDYVVWTENTDSVTQINNAEVIFAGFGVVAPEYNWNDYAGLDVRGKVVLVMVNDPGFTIGDTSLFKGQAMTYYGRWTYKFEEAARQGARGCLIIHNTLAASYPFSVVQSSNGGSKLHLDKRRFKEYRCPLMGWISEPAAMRLLNAAGQDSGLFIRANHRGAQSLKLNLKLSALLRTKAIFSISHNVVGLITGSQKPDECVIYTAHWDHLGIGRADARGDSIYNGALDNASGTAALMELARAFMDLHTRPARTVIFLSVTAEEQGLLGSAYYTEHPLFPLDKTVANINIDGINAFGRTKDISISGAGQSQLEDYLQEEVSKHGRYVSPESHPEAGYFYRSHHFNFAKARVPAFTTNAGIDNVARGKAYGLQQENDYTAKRYHQPSDEYDSSRWDLSGGMEDLNLLFQIGKRLAQGTEWPQWKPGSEFKAVREKSLNKG